MAVPCPSFKARAYASPKPSHDASSTAAHDACHLRALVLVTTFGPSPAPLPRRALPRPLPRTRLLPDLVTDGFCQGRLRVYMNQAP
jgi:hypothetical protein